jgi:hypothetical protein
LKTTSINSNSKFTKEKEMADFRKWFLVLAVLALVAVPVSAQQPTCATSSSPTVVRDGGLTELVGDVEVVCDNTVTDSRSAPQNVTTNFYAAMNLAPVTNKVLNNTGMAGECPTGIQCVTDSFMVESDAAGPLVLPGGAVQQPIIGLLQSNLGGTDAPNTRNKILFENVFIPAGTVTTIRISNIRIACEESPATVANGLTQIYEQVSSNNVTFSGQNSVPVATVLVPMQFKATGCNGSGSANTSFQQCVGRNVPVSAMSSTFNVQFIEGFALAFKPRTSTISQPVGSQFLSESGYLMGTLTSPGGSAVPNVGLASTGTNLIVGFTNIPAGVNIFVTDNQTFYGTSQTPAPGSVPAIKASDSLSTAAGTMSCGGPDVNLPSHQVPIVGGAGSVSWVVTSISSALNYQKTISFGVAVSYSPNTTLGLPGLTVPPGGGVTGALGPISTTDWAVPLNNPEYIPRFLNNPIASSIFSVNPCSTLILFPYLTVKAGFDTGIALVNTSLDNLSTQTQHGPCTMYYFDASGTPPSPQTTCDIAPGGMVAYSLMGSGGIPSATCASGTTVTNTPIPIGWQGYGIAMCNFQYGHGYAFVSDRNIPGLGSQGYLALILSTCGGRNPSPLDNAGYGCGEMLIH